MEDAAADPGELDPRRWVALGIAILSAFIVVLDNTVLNVAIPTILRDLDTTLPALQWVITGYSLTFATFLIIGGRLGDVYGHRRIFIVGAGLFGVGSLIAASSTSVAQLIFGEAVVEGLGASMLLPATLAILSSTFKGRERATAFAAWGATAGVAAACGPLVGGFLTTNFSWRWAFVINVIVAPLTILGAVLFMSPARPQGKRVQIDVPGAVLVAIGTFLLVLGLSEGGRYGWWEPLQPFKVGSVELWPGDGVVSVIPVMFVIAAGLLYAFVRLERWKEQTHRDPLFEFGHLRLRTYRYGLLTGVVIGMGQLGVNFVLAVFMQDGLHLSAQENGVWLLPSGIFIIVGAQAGRRFVHRFGVTWAVRGGLFIDALGIAVIATVLSHDMSGWALLPGLALYGTGIGIAGAQLTNVVLSEIPAESSGVASGANTTARQIGNALGVAVIGTLLTSRALAAATDGIQALAIPGGLKDAALERLQAVGTSFTPPGIATSGQAAELRRVVQDGLLSGTRAAVIFAATVVGLGFLMSWLIPTEIPVSLDEPLADPFEPVEPLDPDPALRRLDDGSDPDAEGDTAPWPSSNGSRSIPRRPQSESPPSTRR
ncbi:MAG: MFS transporter [Acidimicrobiia bacterium]|nr:MFS transporter [Acidimicrobiia bacterium]